MPSHKEILLARHADAERAFRQAGEEVSRLAAQVKTEENAIEGLNAQHSAACRTLASGGSADSASILAELAGRADRLNGIRQLKAEAEAALVPAQEAHQQSSAALQAENDRVERENLENALAAANQQVSEARAALNAAEQKMRTASQARSQFLRKQELKRQEELRLQRERA